MASDRRIRRVCAGRIAYIVNLTLNADPWQNKTIFHAILYVMDR